MAAVAQETIAPTVSAEDLTALRQAVVNFDRSQLIWSSGYLAGLAGSTAPVAIAHAPQAATAESTWHIFYATETGNSRQVAEQLAQQSESAGLVAELHDLRDARPRILKNIEHAVFVLATHGIGEAPEGSEAFFEFWMSDKAPKLAKLNYSVLALGDSSYADFCEMGKVFDARLRQLGASPIVDRVDCDLDFETPAAEWTDQIIEHARETAPALAPVRPAHLSAVPSTQAYSKQRPFNAEIVTRQAITGRGSSKAVLHLELDLEGSGLAYLPGDSLGVVASNPPQIVADLAKATGLSSEDLGAREITALSRPILNAVAETHPELQSILQDREQFARYLATHQLIDLVHEYPVDWAQARYLESLRKLAPRSYSIASSPDANPNEAHLAVAVVDYEKYGRPHWGSASNFLAGDTTHAPVFVEANENFRLPQDPDTPIIMVGAGTGVAPYRAFVEHRREHGHTGRNWLVFGDRNFSSDFLYQLEWLRYRKEGTLSKLDVAFSRDQSRKLYVQHRLIENGAQVFDWLQQGANFYICGDATRMAGDVHDALLSIVGKHGGYPADAANDYVNDLKKTRRYQRDVY